MKKRYLYALLFGIPGFFISVMLSLFLFGTLFGILWIFVYGDNPWPDSITDVSGMLLILAFLILWAGLIAVGYFVGKKLETTPTLNKNHIQLSSGLTILFLILILFQPFNVGNLGPKSDSEVCSAYCLSKGYAASGMPP